MAWVVLFVAGLFEVGWAVCLKSSRGFTAIGPSVGFGVFMLASVYLLGVALKTLPLRPAYTVWTGIGAVGTVVFGFAFLGEPMDFRRALCVGLVLSGVVGLKMTSAH